MVLDCGLLKENSAVVRLLAQLSCKSLQYARRYCSRMVFKGGVYSFSLAIGLRVICCVLVLVDNAVFKFRLILQLEVTKESRSLMISFGRPSSWNT